MIDRKLTVAVPWSLTHYIPLNGFHPLYQGLFQRAPQWLRLCAWDNIELSQRLRGDKTFRTSLLNEIKADEKAPRFQGEPSVERDHSTHFWAANYTLTRLLPGDIEFHHTAPFPTLKRPFVFHCESFAPVFFPFAHQGTGSLGTVDELRSYYRSIFEHSLCLGIFSHLPGTLKDLSLFLESPTIDAKLFSSRIGLFRSDDEPVGSARGPLSEPLFLFINSANQNPGNFFLRGGHVVLRFWQQAHPAPGTARLILRCSRPNDAMLQQYGVDVEWLKSCEQRSVIWIENYLSHRELNSLMQAAHFFLLPSNSLHSVSIMQAMASGSLPIVSDTIGTDRYVEDGIDGVILKGVLANNWCKDQETGVMIDTYKRNPILEDELVQQLIVRVGELIADQHLYSTQQARAVEKARTEFSGQSFSDNFWEQIYSLSDAIPKGSSTHSHNRIQQKIDSCLLENRDWPRMFTSAPQPVDKLNAGQGRVTELGGCFIATPEAHWGDIHLWSPVAEHIQSNAPSLVFASDIKGLGGRYLGCPTHELSDVFHCFITLVAERLKPFPPLYAFAAMVLHLMRSLHKAVFLRSEAHEPFLCEADIELVVQGVRGLNVIRCNHLFYAIHQSDGEFIESRATAGHYSVCISGTSLREVLRKIDATPDLSPSSKVELVEAGFHGFNLIHCGDTFYAIPESEGAFDIQRVLSQKYSRFHVGNSVEDVRAAIIGGTA